MKISDIMKTTPDTVSKFLDTAPKDELYSNVELACMFNISKSTIRHSERLSKYKVKFGETVYYGSPEAIQEFKERINEN